MMKSPLAKSCMALALSAALVFSTVPVGFAETAKEEQSTPVVDTEKAQDSPEAQQEGKKKPVAKTRWQKLLQKYETDKKTDRLIFVKYKGKRKATLVMYKKPVKRGETSWKKVLSCAAVTGKNGINKKREGDKKTPTGTFDITMGFGIKKNPGTKIKYKKLNRHLYWSGERATYNQMVDSRKLGHAPAGEHLINYSPHYNYALAIGYNPKNVYKKGSAIFLHVKGGSYTAGCVGVSQKNMIKILKLTTKKTKICIYKK